MWFFCYNFLMISNTHTTCSCTRRTCLAVLLTLFCIILATVWNSMDWIGILKYWTGRRNSSWLFMMCDWLFLVAASAGCWTGLFMAAGWVDLHSLFS